MSSPFTQEDFMQTLGQYLGITEEELSSGGTLLDALAPIPDEAAIKADLRDQFKDVLGNLQETSIQGYGESVKEAISSQQRQQLAEAARRTGSSQRMLAGRTKAAALSQAKFKQVQQQAGVVQDVAEKDKELKESAKQQLQDLETSLAESAQSQADADRERRRTIGMSLYQLAELARQKTETGG